VSIRKGGERGGTHRRGCHAGDMAVVLYPVVGSWFVVRGFTFCWPGRPMSRVRDEAVVQ